MSRMTQLIGLAAIVSLVFLAACSGPEAKKQKFYDKGKALFEKEEYVKARLELKNAIQIDPKFSQAFQMVGLIDMKEGNLKGAFGSFSKACELDSGNKVAQYQLGKIYLAVQQPDKAQEKADLLLKQDPAYPDGLLLKGAVLVARKEHAAARRFLEEIIGRGVHSPDAFLLLANACWEGGDLKAGEGAVARGLAANPSSVELILTQASILAKGKRLDEAATLLAKACTLEPKNLNHALNLAQFQWSCGKEPQAMEVLNRLVTEDPKSEERCLKVAGFYVQHGRPVEAERVLKEGIAKDHKGFPLRFALSEFYLNGSHADQGIAVLKECATLDKEGSPGVIQAKTVLARLSLQKGELEQAASYVDQVLKESPKNVEARFIKGSIHLQKGDGAGAVTEFRTVVSEKPQFAPGYIKLAEAHLLKKEVNLALDSLKSAQKLDPDSREVQIAFARYYAIAKDFKGAEAVLRKLVAKSPDDLEARVELGDLLAQAGDGRRAEAEYAVVKAKAPTLPIGYVKTGALYLRQGKRASAIAEYGRAQKLNPGSWLIANDLAFMISETAASPKELDRALELAEKARVLNPTGANVLDTLGWLYYLKGEAPKAVELLRQVLAKTPDSPVVNYHLGMALYKTGKLAEAKQSLAKSISGKGSFTGRDEAARTLARI